MKAKQAILRLRKNEADSGFDIEREIDALPDLRVVRLQVDLTFDRGVINAESIARNVFQSIDNAACEGMVTDDVVGDAEAPVLEKIVMKITQPSAGGSSRWKYYSTII